MYRIALARRADIRDLPAVERRACERFRAHPSTAELPLYLTPLAELEAARRAGRLWVARLGEDPPVGFALVEPLGDGWHLEELDVLPEHGRRGVGSALVRRVCAWSQAKGPRTLTLCTFRDVPWNAPFYERLGFRPLGTAELTAALRERMREEADRGLPLDRRVAMRFEGGSA